MKKELQLKVCGMRDAANINEVSQLHPDFMGFIFYRDSPRYVGDTFTIPEELPASIKRVGVFVNESTERILQLRQQHGLDFAQLHGGETVAQCVALKAEGLGVIKVFSIDDKTDFEMTAVYEDAAHFFLFDAKGKYYGGNARRFNWDVLSQYKGSVPFFLSGGITPENATEVLTLHHPGIFALDINSGVETRAAFKDAAKIRTIRAIIKI